MTNKDLLRQHLRTSLGFVNGSGGFAVRVNLGNKSPAKGWDPKSNTKEQSDSVLGEIQEALDANTEELPNLGVHLHGSLVDVDIDSDDQFLQAALDAFLPPCSHVWGRPSRLRTHRCYTLRLQESEVFDPGRIGFLSRLKRIDEAKVEIRGGPLTRGEYSVLPGSVHPSGEPYLWADPDRAASSLSVTTVDRLLRAVRLAAAAAVLAPHFQEGMRNELTMALSGFLYRLQAISKDLGEEHFALSHDEASDFLQTFLDVVGDDINDRYSRLKTFTATWKKAEKGTPVTGAKRLADLAGDNSLVKKLYFIMSDSPDILATEEFLRRFVIWQGPGRVVDLDSAVRSSSHATMARTEFVNSHGHVFIRSMGAKKDKVKQLATELFVMQATTRVSGLTFDPTAGVLVDSPGGLLVNQWGGFAIAPHTEPVPDEEVEPFLDYLWQVIADEQTDRYDWVIGWLAHIFKEPANKSRTALVLVGVPGAGKSLLGHQIVLPIIGEKHAVVTNSIEAMTKDFNAGFDNKLFIQCDEAINNRQRQTATRLKSIITDPIMRVEYKGVDAVEKPNLARLLFTSNETNDAIFLTDGRNDRRYTILQVSECRRGKIAYWTEFVGWLKRPGTLAKIHRWLLDVEYSHEFISLPLETDTKHEMQQHSWPVFDAWLATWLATNHPVLEDAHTDWWDAPTEASSSTPIARSWSNQIDRTEWPRWVSLTALTRSFASYYQRSSGKFRSSEPLYNESQLAIELRKRGFLEGETARVSVSYNDDKKNARVRKFVRLYQLQPREVIYTHLHLKYGLTQGEWKEYLDPLNEDEAVSTVEENTKF